jgi:hypothetical protein
VQPRWHWSRDNSTLMLLTQDGLTLIVMDAASGNFRLLPVEEPAYAQRLSWTGDRWHWVSEDGLTLTIFSMTDGAAYPLRFGVPIYRVFLQPEGRQALAQGIDGSLWWAPDYTTDRVEMLVAEAPEARFVKWSPSGDQVAFASLNDIYLIRLK